MASVLSILSYILLILSAGMIILFMFCIPKAIHIFQQESYQFRDYFRWVIKNPKKAFGAYFRYFILNSIYFLSMVIIDVILYYTTNLSIESKRWIYLIQTLMYEVIFYISTIKCIIKWKKERKEAKKKLVYTARVKRLIFWCFIVTLLLEVSLEWNLDFLPRVEYAHMVYAQKVFVYSLLILTMPIVLSISAFCASPTEMIINDHYMNSARFKF